MCEENKKNIRFSIKTIFEFILLDLCKDRLSSVDQEAV